MTKNREQGSKVAPLPVLLFGLNKPKRNIIFRRVTSQAYMLGVSHSHKARGRFGRLYVALMYSRGKAVVVDGA